MIFIVHLEDSRQQNKNIFMNRRLLAIISISIFFCGRVFAIEYPDLPGIDPITDESNVEDYAEYYYAVIVALMIAIATLKVSMTGLGLLLSEGSPQSFSKFKNDLIGVIVGIVILLSPFLVMKAINPEPGEREDMECSDLLVCIVREKKDVETGKVKKSLEMSIASQNINDEQTITVKKYYGLQHIIGFNKGPAKVFYSDNPDNDDYSMSLPPGEEVVIDTPLVGGNGQLDPNNPEKMNNNQGLIVMSKIDGAFLYELPLYTPNLYPPLFLKGSYTNLENVNYKDSVKSIDIVNSKKDQGYDYLGIAAQSDVNKIEKCAIFYKDIPDVDNDERLKSLEGRMNYITIFKRDKNYFKNLNIRLILYNNGSCSEKGAEVAGKASQQLEYCEITFEETGGEIIEGLKNDENPVCDDEKCSVTLSATKSIVSPTLISKACPNLVMGGGSGGFIKDPSLDKYQAITPKIEVRGMKVINRQALKWNGSQKVFITGTNPGVNGFWMDDILIIHNATNGKQIVISPETIATGRYEMAQDIASILEPGKENNLRFSLQDISDGKAEINAIWLYIEGEKERGTVSVGQPEVYSFRIDTPSAIVFLDNGGRCNIYDDIRIGRGEGVCNQINFKGYATDEFIPQKVFVVPYNR